MAAPEPFAGVEIVLGNKCVHECDRRLQSLRLAKSAEYGAELFCVGAAQQHLVLNSAKEGFVSQLVRREISGKNQKGLEGDRHLSAIQERQIVYPALHRNNPSVEDFRGGSFLPHEVVNQVDSIVCFQLKRRSVDF